MVLICAQGASWASGGGAGLVGRALADVLANPNHAPTKGCDAGAGGDGQGGTK
jgi:hypothetical protein